MMTELGDVAGEPIAGHAGYTDDSVFSYRLISRRMLDVYNSSGRDIPHLTRRYSYNPAFMHPADLQRDGLAEGDVIEIDSGHAKILGVVAAAPDVVPGAISMAHAWGDSPEHDADVFTIGSNTGRLTDNASHFDAITGLPRMSAIPVNIRLVPAMARSACCEEA
jgi:anaerobic selenocysteine-containing dehydrogenase